MALTLLIPIIAIIFGCGIAIVAIIAEYLDRRRYYESLVKALEMSKEPEKVRALFEHPKKQELDIIKYLHKGIITIAVGLGLVIIGLFFINTSILIGIGILLCFLGLAFLLMHHLVKKNRSV